MRLYQSIIPGSQKKNMQMYGYTTENGKIPHKQVISYFFEFYGRETFTSETFSKNIENFFFFHFDCLFTKWFLKLRGNCLDKYDVSSIL